MSSFNIVNSFRFNGFVAELRELKSPDDGKVYGHAVSIGQVVGKAAVEFRIERDTWKALSVGDSIEVRGHIDQKGFRQQIVVDQVGKPVEVDQPKAKAS